MVYSAVHLINVHASIKGHPETSYTCFSHHLYLLNKIMDYLLGVLYSSPFVGM